MIGVFDSGVGGLSVLREIRRQLPGEPLLYVADSGNAPYGERSPEFIVARATEIVRFLVASGARAVVIACNTATVVAVQALRDWCPVPIVAIEPAIKPAVALTGTGVIGVLATRRTLESASVARLCELHGQAARILLQACPGLVERVERGELDTPGTRELLRSFLRPLLDARADVLVLGCTHYPFLAPLIQELAGPAVSIVDPAAAVARELRRRLGLALPDASLADAANPGFGPAQERFLSSGPLASAREVMSALWGRALEPAALPALGPDARGPQPAAAGAAQPLPNPELTCPLCAGPNACAPAASGSFDTPCWCTGVEVDPCALERVPAQQLRRACLCPRCASGRPPASGEPGLTSPTAGVARPSR